MPRTISKYGRPLPYFMRYASPYYKKLTLSKTHSNLNRLCWELERWQRKIRYKRTDKSFDASIMMDDAVVVTSDVLDRVERLYKAFCDDQKALVQGIPGDDEEARKAAFGALYDKYRTSVLLAADGDVSVAANAAVWLSQKHKSWNQKFPWIVAGAGIVQNIEQVDVVLPQRDSEGRYEYLGKKYSMVRVPKEDVSF